MALGKVVKVLNEALGHFDVALVRRSRLPSTWWIHDALASQPKFQLPDGAEQYLRRDNPQLLDYIRRYRGHPATKHSAWNDSATAKDIDLCYFRADNMYIWQTRGLGQDPMLPYAVTTAYVHQNDKMNLLGRLREDNSFGAVTFPIHLEADVNCVVSRDLLDSILEINFLERYLHISEQESFKILDIGAGYGRLAHRLAETFSNIDVFCADAVPESTFLCEYYLQFRGAQSRAKTIPLDRVEAAIDENSIDLVTNIQSFPECPMESISWWLELIGRHRISYFMLVVQNQPSGEPRLLSRERDDTRKDFRPLIEQQGFELEPISKLL